MTDRHARLKALAAARGRVAAALTAGMVLIYFGFIGLVAFARPVLSRVLVPGLTLGIALGALVIVASWLLTLWYVRWANLRYDGELERLRNGS